MAKSLWWLAPVALPVLAAAAARRRSRHARTLSVQARGEFRARPEAAVVELAIETVNAEMKEAYVQAQVEAERARARLRASGFAPEAVQWGAFRVEHGEGGFRIRARAELVIAELRMLDPLVAALSGGEVKPVRSIGFRLQNRAAAEEAAVAEACRQAQRKAMALAKDWGLPLGRVQSVRLGRIAGAGRAQASLSVEEAAAAAPFQPREIVVTASVTAIYRLGA